MPPMLNRYNDSLIDTFRHVRTTDSFSFVVSMNWKGFIILIAFCYGLTGNMEKILQNLKPGKRLFRKYLLPFHKGQLYEDVVSM